MIWKDEPGVEFLDVRTDDVSGEDEVQTTPPKQTIPPVPKQRLGRKKRPAPPVPQPVAPVPQPRAGTRPGTRAWTVLNKDDAEKKDE